MKRSTFLLTIIAALAVPVYFAHRAYQNKFDSIATAIDAVDEASGQPDPNLKTEADKAAQESKEKEAAQAEKKPVQAVQEKESTTAPTATTSTATVSQVKPTEEDEFDEDAKKKAVTRLIDRGIDAIKKNPFNKSMSLITHSRDLVDGELYLFVYNMKGICLAHGQSPELIWQNKLELRDPFGTYIIKESIAAAQTGGGWVTYQWRNATKITYIKPFEKDGTKYLIGTGYYTHSKPDGVIKLVKGAVGHFKNAVTLGDQSRLDEVFGLLSYPIGRFLQGDLYLYALDFQGNLMANGERPGLIGTNVLNDKDESGKAYNKEIIKKLQESPEGVWTEYQSKNTTKRVYAEKVRDKKGKEYFIASSYYPLADRNALIDLVRKGYDFLKKHGVSAAAKEFTDRNINTFRFGDLYLMAFDMKGNAIANGENPDLVGLNQMNLQDDDGRFWVKEVIEKAQKGGGWSDFKLKNAFESIYAEKVDLGLESYVIASGVYPVSRRETALLLTRSAANFLRTRPSNEVFATLGNGNSTFVRGDLSVFVIDQDGICEIYGDNYDLIWRNLMDAKDDDGKEYVKLFINTAKAGPGKVSYVINGVRRIAFVERVEKDGMGYTVGSGYFI